MRKKINKFAKNIKTNAIISTLATPIVNDDDMHDCIRDKQFDFPRGKNNSRRERSSLFLLTVIR